MAQTDVLDATPSIHPTFSKTSSEENIPELEAGDRLTRHEFHRRYEAMPNLKKAELVEGVVYMSSPVKLNHAEYTYLAASWLGWYSALTPGVRGAENGTVLLDEDNEPQPDIFLRISEECGGQSWRSETGYLEGAPELVIEIASSCASYDLHDKKNVYRRNGVKEYLVWRVKDHQIDWFASQDGAFVLLHPDANGIIESTIFPGLRLAVQALLNNDMAIVLAELQQGIASPAHQAFVELLQNRKTSG